MENKKKMEYLELTEDDCLKLGDESITMKATLRELLESLERAHLISCIRTASTLTGVLKYKYPDIHLIMLSELMYRSSQEHLKKVTDGLLSILEQVIIENNTDIN